MKKDSRFIAAVFKLCVGKLSILVCGLSEYCFFNYKDARAAVMKISSNITTNIISKQKEERA